MEIAFSPVQEQHKVYQKREQIERNVIALHRQLAFSFKEDQSRSKEEGAVKWVLWTRLARELWPSFSLTLRFWGSFYLPFLVLAYQVREHLWLCLFCLELISAGKHKGGCFALNSQTQALFYYLSLGAKGKDVEKLTIWRGSKAYGHQMSCIPRLIVKRTQSNYTSC